MNTPAHLVANLLVLGAREQDRERAGPIALGAVLPDGVAWRVAWRALAASYALSIGCALLVWA